MERRTSHSRKQKTSLRRTMVPLLTIAACLFVFLVIVENREVKPENELSTPDTLIQEPVTPEPEQITPPEVVEPEPEVTTAPPTTEPTEPQTEPTQPEVTEPDETPPEISGAKSMMVYLGDSVSYRKAVKIKDNQDPDPKLTVDSSQVDLSTEGTYEVVYTAEDASGNTSTLTMEVKVIPKSEDVDLEKLYADVDKVLAKIIKDDMTTKQQVEAIYKWARRSLGYSSYKGSDWIKAAQHMLSKRTGDCFNYFAVCKLMFERLGIPNIDVVKVKKSSSSSAHYWSLVSIDGGENYYHFDSTPRKGDGDNFCLVTDAFIDSYSKKHYGSHNRDKSLYPATPKKALK